jgi:hypothetical protein
MKPQSAAAIPASRPAQQAGDRGIGTVLKSYFYWTHARGSVQYDVMVSLILLFIFITPHLWNFGDRPSTSPGPQHPLTVTWNGGHGVLITVDAADVTIPAGATNAQVKKALRAAIEPVTGDDVFVEHWETVTDAHGNVTWKVWAHK